MSLQAENRAQKRPVSADSWRQWQPNSMPKTTFDLPALQKDFEERKQIVDMRGALEVSEISRVPCFEIRTALPLALLDPAKPTHIAASEKMVSWIALCAAELGPFT